MSDNIESLKEFTKTLPTESGVYLMKNQEQDVIYIGKAKNLRSRVRSYFLGQDERYQIKFLLKRVDSIETIITDTEEQSLILERDLINKYKPRYNIRLKDDKNYLSIRIDQDAEWPKLELVRKVEQDGAKYFGPYTYSYEVRELIELINKTIPLRTCSDTVFYNRQRPCLEYQIKRCLGPCCLPVDPEDYRDQVKQAIGILDGKIENLVENLEVQMEKASEALNYEDAALARDRIEILRKFKTGQKYISSGTESRDVFALYREDSLAVLSVMQVRNGRIAYNKNYSFELVQVPNDEIIQTLIEQYYSTRKEFPDEIVVSNMPQNLELLSKYLKQKAEHKVEITCPKRGLKFRLLNLALLNAEKHFDLKFNSESDHLALAKELTKLCNLQQTPRRIEAIDISNLQGSDIVGAVVSFFDAKPYKSKYKKYKISFEGQPNDFQAIYEVVKKRIKVAVWKNDFPDLIIIDGGKLQLEYAKKALDEYNVELDIIALAKERQASDKAKREYKPERIFLVDQEQPILLKPDQKLTKFIARIRDEVHRFVITYHRSKRTKRVITSVLDHISGVGPERKKRLLNAFGSVEQIKLASVEEIMKRVRVPYKIAEKIKAHLT